jgi:hypothetical protein
MKQEVYNRSIKTQELQLISSTDKIMHFSIVGYLLFLPVILLSMHLLSQIRGLATSFHEGEIWLITISLVLSAAAYLLQKRRLKFKVIKTTLNKEKLKEVITQVAKELEWEKGAFSAKTYTTKTNPKFFSGSWGEQITVLFNNDTVFINSICDLKKKPSIASWGRNNKNEDTLMQRINEANQVADVKVL